MLLELRAENYALIDRASASFGPGLNLLTGETGAGKSVLIDALALLLGSKASSDMVRHGAEKAVVSCVFEKTVAAGALLQDAGIDIDAEEILLRREVFANGKGRAFVNDQPVTVSLLKSLAPELALIHAQADTSGVFDQRQQRQLLDKFGKISLAPTRDAFQRWKAVSKELNDLQVSEQDRLRTVDLFHFQALEIADAGLETEDEDTRLEAEKLMLANADKLSYAAGRAHDLLYESENSAETILGAALRHLEELAHFGTRFHEPLRQLVEAKALVEEVDDAVRRFAETANASPDRLTEIEDRLALLERLKRKYGKTLTQVIAFGKQVTDQLSEIEHRDVLLLELQIRRDAEAQAYRRAASALSKVRCAEARRLAKGATAQINDLAMRAVLEIEVAPHSEDVEWGADGWDEISYLIATNPGEPMKPLNEIASGGEMSRVMLALKVTVEEEVFEGAKQNFRGEGRTLIFDEIDTGVGGRAAEAIGRKLKALSKAQQVLCITHLPQIASFGDSHFLIEKLDSGGRLLTRVRHVKDSERAHEIARMLSGELLTETSLRHAEHLLSSGTETHVPQTQHYPTSEEDQAGAMNNDLKKCAHPSCNCIAPKDEKCCSTSCRNSIGLTTLKCDCGHSGCGASLI